MGVDQFLDFGVSLRQRKRRKSSHHSPYKKNGTELTDRNWAIEDKSEL